MKHATKSPLHRLQVALDANAGAYRRAVQTSAPGECWDVVVLTAANEKQAAGYRQELALRHRSVGTAGVFFPAITRTLVVPDPPARRAGSGGATLGVMRALVEQLQIAPERLVDDLRILLIHSGGASQRLPMYSPVGKIFAPLPLLRPDGQIATLFDHLFLTLSGLPERLGPGMLVLAGDVFLLFDHRHVTTPPPGVTALTMRVDAELGRAHGVFATIADDQAVRKTLQKVTVAQMRAEGAADADGRVLIDTGLLFFDAERTRLVAALAGVSPVRRRAHFSEQTRRRSGRRGLHERFAQPLDLYEDMTAALATGTDERGFLAPAPTRALRRELWQSLHGVPFRAIELDGEFLHLGTTRQFRDAMTGHNPSPAAELFQRNVLTHSDWPLSEGRRAYHSVLLSHDGKTGALGNDTVIEHSILRGDVRVGAGGVVSQCAITGPLALAPQRLLFQVPIRIGEAGRRTRARGASIDGRGAAPETTDVWFVHVLCGVADDFKGRLLEGNCRFLNEPVERWLDEKKLDAEDVWPHVTPEQRTLWTAALFPATPRRDGVAGALAVLERGPVSAADRRRWRASRRYSMAMLLESADPAALIEHRDVISARLQTAALLERIRRGDDVPAEAIVGHYVTPTAYYAALDGLTEAAKQPPADAATAVWQARALWSAAELLQRPDHPAAERARSQVEPYRDAAFARVADASEVGHATIRIAATDGRAALVPGMEVTATAPVRLDLAGGWTDTPPYCFERGGHVVNVAIELDNRAPVRVVVRTLRQPRLLLRSHDLGRELELHGSPPATTDVRDPFALHRIALAMTGLLPADGDGDVARHLRSLGCGLHVSTECRVPKGSGLGTSSILAATLLAALHRVRGTKTPNARLLEQTLLLEQRLGTGGGWQDQVGGIVGGAKSTTTGPGIPQRLDIEPLALSDAQLTAIDERLVVYYSGQQRLARDILRRVMGRWLGREPAVLGLMAELKDNARAQRDALLKGRWTAVGREAARYWRIKKELYPPSTTPFVDVLFLELQSLYVGAGLAGAGGGGFAYFVCRNAKQADRLRHALAERSARPGSLGAVYAATINRTGLVVSARRV